MEVDVSKSLEWLDWVAVLAYLGVVAWIGLRFATRQKSTEDYFVGGRSVPGWAAGISLFASSISTVTFLAYPGQGYGGDWTLLFPGLMLPIVAVVLTLVIIPLYRQVVQMSAYEYLERRFGYGARFYAAFLYLLLRLFRMSFVLFLMAKALHTLTGWNIVAVIIVCGVVTVVYTMLGGVRAVIWTDVMQAFVLLGGGLFCIGMLLLTADGGPGHAIDIAWQDGKFKLADLSLSLTEHPEAGIIVMTLYGLFFFATDFFTSQDYVQRYLSVPTTRKACQGVWVGVCSTLTTWILFISIGTLLYAFYKIHPDQIPDAVASDETKVFPHFIMTCLPAGVVGLIVAAMCAAGMSTLSTVLNSMSMVVIYDFAARLWPSTSDRRQLLAAKLTTLGWGVVGTLAALSMIQVEQALKFWLEVFSILLGGLLGMFLLAFFVRRAHAWGVYIGLAAGVLVTLWGTIDQLGNLAEEFDFPWPDVLARIHWPLHKFMLVVYSNTIAFLVGCLASLIIPDSRKRDTAGLMVWDLRKETLDS